MHDQSLSSHDQSLSSHDQSLLTWPITLLTWPITLLVQFLSKRFSHPVSLFKSVIFSPIIILFLQYSRKWKLPYKVWCSIFYSKLVNCILFKIIVQHVRFVKGKGTCGSGERNVNILIDFRKSPRFSLTSPLSQLREKSSRPVFTMCGEPCRDVVFSRYCSFHHDMDWNIVESG